MGRFQHELGLVEQLRAQCQVERHREPLGGTVNGEGAREPAVPNRVGHL